MLGMESKAAGRRGNEGALTATIKMRVSPDPGALDLLRRYRDAVNYAVGVILAKDLKTVGEAHRELYEVLKTTFGLPSRIALDCYRDALALAKAWRRNPKRGRRPIRRKLAMWLSHGTAYRIGNGHVEIIGGLRLKVEGWDRRYDQYPSREARLVYRGGALYLYVAKQVPKQEKYHPRDVIAVDVNEREVVYGNGEEVRRIETKIEEAMRLVKHAERIQEKYSAPKAQIWRRRSGVLKRIRALHRRAKNILTDWARKTALKIVREAKSLKAAVAREDLRGLKEGVRKLAKDHRRRLLYMGYSRLLYWIDWQAEKHGVPVMAVNPRGTSTTCPRCGARLLEVGRRYMRCPNCGFEGDRDVIAVINIRLKALKMGGALPAPTAPQMTDETPSRWGEPMNRPKRISAI